MERLQSVDEYKSIVRQVKSESKTYFSNSYYLSADIQRYIELGQAYYEKEKNGFILILDEERYYRVCLIVDSSEEIVIPSLDKRAVIKNVYCKGKEEDGLEIIENSLEKLGFEREGTVVQIKGDISAMLAKCEHLARYVEKMEKKGFRCVVADETYFDRIDQMLFSSEKVRDYQIDYKTREEKKELKKGTFLCILNDKEELCAVNACYIEGQIAYGEGVAIADEYKMHGLAPIMTYHRLKWLAENEVKKVHAWVLVDNTASMRYHTSIGYEVANKYVNEWVKK